jgi:hypothetical protein
MYPIHLVLGSLRQLLAITLTLTLCYGLLCCVVLVKLRCGLLKLRVTTLTLSCVVFLCYVVLCRVDGIVLWFLEEEYDSAPYLVQSSLV